MKVGSIVKTKLEILGNPEGSIGVCYEEYKLGVLDGHSFIFENGEYDGFSKGEQEEMLEEIGESRSIQAYVFEKVMKLSDDFKAGMFDCVFKEEVVIKEEDIGDLDSVLDSGEGTMTMPPIEPIAMPATPTKAKNPMANQDKSNVPEECLCTPGHEGDCWFAEGSIEECQCECGGINHGIAHKKGLTTYKEAEAYHAEVQKERADRKHISKLVEKDAERETTDGGERTDDKV